MYAMTPFNLLPPSNEVAHIQWGAGYNMCPGRHLAHLEIPKIAATLLHAFDIALVDPTRGVDVEVLVPPLAWQLAFLSDAA